MVARVAKVDACGRWRCCHQPSASTGVALRLAKLRHVGNMVGSLSGGRSNYKQADRQAGRQAGRQVPAARHHVNLKQTTKRHGTQSTIDQRAVVVADNNGDALPCIKSLNRRFRLRPRPVVLHLANKPARADVTLGPRRTPAAIRTRRFAPSCGHTSATFVFARRLR